MKNLFPITIGLLMCGSGQAQTPAASSVDSTAAQTQAKQFANSKNFSFQRYKWDLSIDASFILPRINQPVIYSPSSYSSPLNNYSPYDLGRSTTLMLRKNETVLNEANVPVRKGAYRLNINWAADFGRIKQDSVRIDSSVGFGIVVEDDVSYAGLGVLAGYEWQQQFGRFQIFYGADAFVGYFGDTRSGTLYYKIFDPTTNQATPAMKKVELLTRRTTLGIAPLVGVKFFIYPRISISIENKAFVRYAWNYQKQDYSPAFSSRTAKGHGLATDLAPLSAFNLTFHFGKVVKP